MWRQDRSVRRLERRGLDALTEHGYRWAVRGNWGDSEGAATFVDARQRMGYIAAYGGRGRTLLPSMPALNAVALG